MDSGTGRVFARSRGHVRGQVFLALCLRFIIVTSTTNVQTIREAQSSRCNKISMTASIQCILRLNRVTILPNGSLRRCRAYGASTQTLCENRRLSYHSTHRGFPHRLLKGTSEPICRRVSQRAGGVSGSPFD
jgi:hypothetical protein